MVFLDSWLDNIVCYLLSRVWLSATPRQAPLSMKFSRQEYWSGLPFPPPGHLPDPGIEPTSPVFCIGGWILYQLSHQGSPLEWVVYPFSSRSSWPRDQTGVSCITGRYLPIQKMRIRSLSREDPLEKAMATHSNILAWEIPWTEEPGGL